jgi:ABC-2 type transport system permease protein
MIKNIQQLISLEYLKFRKNNVVVLLLGIFFIASPFLIFFGKNISELPPPAPGISTIFEFPLIWDYQGYAGRWMIYICLGFFMVYIVTSENANKTMRQNIITGLTRNEYFFGKLWVMGVIAFTATLIYSLSAILIGAIHTEGWDMELMMKTNWAPLRYFMACMAFMSLAMLIGFYIRRGTLAILLYFMYFLILEPIIRGLVKYKLKIPELASLLPANALEDLFPFPLYKLTQNMGEEGGKILQVLEPEKALLISAIYTGIFIWLAHRTLTKRDIA